MSRLSHVRRIIDGTPVTNLFDPPGKPFGWAHHEERRVIRDHLARRLGSVEPNSQEWFVRENRVSKIQNRLHRRDHSYREMQAIYRRKWAKSETPSLDFTTEELRILVDYFALANNPETAAIGRKAAAVLSSRLPLTGDSDTRPKDGDAKP